MTMTKILKSMGWKNYKGKWNFNEILIDISIFALLGLIAYTYVVM